MRQLLTSAQYLVAAAAAAAGTGNVTGDTIDTAGFEDVTIIANLGEITEDGVPALKAQGGNEDDGGDAADIAGASVTGTDADSNKSLAIQIHRPRSRYITPVLARTGANVAVENIIVILHNASHVPVDQTQFAGIVAIIDGAAENAA